MGRLLGYSGASGVVPVDAGAAVRWKLGRQRCAPTPGSKSAVTTGYRAAGRKLLKRHDEEREAAFEAPHASVERATGIEPA